VIKAIIFDCFGVLAGSAYKEIYRQAGGDIAKDNGFLSDLLNLANTGQINTTELRDRTADRLGISVEQWSEVVNKSEQPNIELLEYAKSLKPNYKLAILSNAGVGTLQRKFTPEQLEIFDELIVSAEVGYIKPQPEIFRLAAERLGVDITECVFIDDLIPYVEAAASLGMRAIQFQNLDQMKQEVGLVLSQT
jgi:HAD superfamily hydrolase (TIGR01509 family)